MKTKIWLCAMAMLLVLPLALPLPLAAKDAVQAAVGAPFSGPTPIVVNNGNPYSVGTFAIGTIQLFYVVNADHFPAGPFASFDLSLGIKAGPTTGQATQYPVNFLTLQQTGSPNVTLTPVVSSFTVTGPTWIDQTVVNISIPGSVPADPALNCDGCEIVGNLQLAAPGGSHLDTPTTVQVHIKLVHLDAPCLRVYDFLTDQGFTTIVTDTVVNLGGPKNNLKVVSTTPFGQFSDNVLIVNTCGTSQTFNLQIILDSHFETNPHNGHGQAVFTYLTSGYVDPASFNLAAFGTGTPQGENLWLSNITVPAGDSFLATVHCGLITGNPVSWLPLTSTNPVGGIFGGFSSSLYTTSTPLSAVTAGTGILDTLAAANPSTSSMSFTVQ
jgi:hypothetical protein